MQYHLKATTNRHTCTCGDHRQFTLTHGDNRLLEVTQEIIHRDPIAGFEKFTESDQIYATGKMLGVVMHDLVMSSWPL